jgi:pimeloyl-ACP methyl ester carboxylesterase
MPHRPGVITLGLLAIACGEPPSPPDSPVREAAMPADHDAHVMQVQRTGTGAPLVLIGGGLTGWLSWEPHAQRLASSREVARFQLLSVQYGLEDRPLPDGYGVKLESRALAAALDSIGWRAPVDLVAWSFGALVTLDFALDNPGRVRTLTLIEPPALWLLPEHGRNDPAVQPLAALAQTLHGQVTEDQLEQFARTVGLIPPGMAPADLPQWPVWLRHRNALRNTVAPFEHDDDPARLAAFDRPVLLVTGTGTAPFFPRILNALAAQLPRATLIELPAGHAPQIVSMNEFIERLTAFLRHR